MTAPLVLLHGWGMAPVVFDPLIAHLPGINCHALPLPGHAGAPTAPPTLADWADAMAANLPDGATVLGWSLGGQVALRLAVRYPDKVARLILVATTPRFVNSARDAADWDAGINDADLQTFGDELLRDPQATLLRFLSLQTRGAPGQKTLLADLRTRLAAAPPPHPDALTSGLALLRDTDLRDRIADIDQPALVVHGGRDLLTPLAAGRWLAARLPRAKRVELPAAAHAPQLSHTAEVAHAIREFLQ